MAILNFCDQCQQYVSRKHESCPKCDLSMKGTKKWQVNLPLPNGKRYIKIVDTKLTDARDLEAKVRNDIKQGKWFGLTSAPMIHDVFKKLLDYNAKRLKRSSTESYWDVHIKPYIPASMTMSQLTTHDVDKILSRMHSKGYKPATIKHVLGVIKRLYNYAKKQGLYVGGNPAENVEPVKVHNTKIIYLEKKQIRKLKKVLKKWRNPRAAQIVLFALYTGCRLGEILSLSWSDVDIKAKEIYLRDPKGKPATIPISSKAVEVLKQANDLRKESKYKSNFVFCNRFGKERKYFNNTWHRIRKEAKLPDEFSFHTLRHTFSTHAASSGKVSLHELQKLLNHQSIQMTMRYAHHYDKTLRKTVDSIDNIF